MKISKVLSVMIVALILVASIANIAYAATNPGDITATVGDGANGIKTIGGKILGIVQTVGSVVAVIILVVLGIKYMMGSTEEKAEYKKTLIPYIVGAILIFAASNIASMVFKAVSNL